VWIVFNMPATRKSSKTKVSDEKESTKEESNGKHKKAVNESNKVGKSSGHSDKVAPSSTLGKEGKHNEGQMLQHTDQFLAHSENLIAAHGGNAKSVDVRMNTVSSTIQDQCEGGAMEQPTTCQPVMSNHHLSQHQEGVPSQGNVRNNINKIRQVWDHRRENNVTEVRQQQRQPPILELTMNTMTGKTPCHRGCQQSLVSWRSWKNQGTTVTWTILHQMFKR
jgi:hypothetical protein